MGSKREQRRSRQGGKEASGRAGEAARAPRRRTEWGIGGKDEERERTERSIGGEGRGEVRM